MSANCIFPAERPPPLLLIICVHLRHLRSMALKYEEGNLPQISQIIADSGRACARCLGRSEDSERACARCSGRSEGSETARARCLGRSEGSGRACARCSGRSGGSERARARCLGRSGDSERACATLPNGVMARVWGLVAVPGIEPVARKGSPAYRPRLSPRLSEP